MKLKNKVALVTGSSRGIGKEIALLFAKEGAKVVVNSDSSENEALEVVKEINIIGSSGIAIKCDVSQEDQVKRMVDKIMQEYGRIDILVNNAGIVYDVPLFEKTVDQWKRTIDVNLFGTFLCSKYVALKMLERKSGKIVNISSTNAINSFSPESLDYDASKAGIITLTKNFAKELAPYIQVNAIAPGWVNTDMNKDLPEDYVEEETQKIYLKRFAEPNEIAEIALFLVSDSASYVTGSVIIADGGHD